MIERVKKIFSDWRLWSVVIAIAAMALISFAYFYPDDAMGNVLQQHDMRQGMANGHEAQAFTDATGEETRWTNALLGGMPTFQIAPSYPSDSLFTWLSDVLTLGLPEPANLLFLMMLGFFILLMAMKMRWYVALIGAVAYGFSSYFIIIINAGHIWKFITLAYIPPTIAGVVLAYRGRYLAGAAVAALFGMLQIASNHVQMTYYFLFVIAGFAIAYLVRAIRGHEMRRWWIATGVLAVAGILAVAANLPSLYNTYEYSKETIRGKATDLITEGAGQPGSDHAAMSAFSYTKSETFTLLIPNIKGGASIMPRQGESHGVTLGDLDSYAEMEPTDEMAAAVHQQITGQLPQYFASREGTNGPVYVGALICAMFLLGCLIVRGPLKWVLLVLTVVSIVVAWGYNFLWFSDFMLDHMPLFNKFRAPESALVVAEFTMPLLAVMALQQLCTTPKEELWGRYGNKLLWSFGAMIVICLVALMSPSLFGETGLLPHEQEMLKAYGIDRSVISETYSQVQTLREGMVRGDAQRSLIIVLCGGALLLLYLRRIVKREWMIAGIGVIVLVDLYTVNKRYLNSDCFMPAPLTDEAVFEATPADKAILADTAMNYRVLDMTQIGGSDPSYFHKSVGGYHAAKLTRYDDMLNYYLFSGEHDYLPMLNMLNTKYLINDLNGMPMINDEAMGNAWLVDRVKYVATPNEEIAAVEKLDLSSEAVADKKFESVLGASTPKSAGDTIFETYYAPNRLKYHVKTAKGGVAVFSEVYFPWGWHATVDGKPVEPGRVNYLLRALKVPAGSHTVEMWFDPESLHTTTTVAYVAIIAIYLLLAGAVVAGLYGKRKDNETAAPQPEKGK
ncbi:MAG: YfhO family protein [Paramuribaculum sp.]